MFYKIIQITIPNKAVVCIGSIYIVCVKYVLIYNMKTVCFNCNLN